MILVYSTVQHFTFFFVEERHIIEEQLHRSVNILLIYYIIIAILVGTRAPIVHFQVFLKYGATLGLMINSSKRKFYSV